MIQLRHGALSVVLSAILAAAAAVFPARACEKGEPCDKQAGWFASFNTFGLRMAGPTGGDSAQFRGHYSAAPGADVQILMDWTKNGVAKQGEAIVLGGRILITNGLDLQEDAALATIEGPLATASLGAALLAEAFPQGAASVQPHNEIKIDNGAHTIETVASGEGGAFLGPWELSGVADKTTSGRISYQLHFKSKRKEPAEPREQGVETAYDVALEGYFENETPAFALPDDKPLKGWKIFGADAQGRDLSSASVGAVGQLRKILRELEASDAEGEAPANEKAK